jgi:lysophospholipase L1-like esterase
MDKKGIISFLWMVLLSGCGGDSQDQRTAGGAGNLPSAGTGANSDQLPCTTGGVSSCDAPDQEPSQPGGDAADAEAARGIENGIVVLGDSVARGMLIETEFGKELPGKIKQSLYDDLASYIMGQEVTMSELEQRYGNLERTAFMGTDPWSHWSQLSSAERALSRKNLAVSGARGSTERSIDFSAQVDQAAQLYGELPQDQRPDYVVVEFGANDWCSSKAPEDFGAAYREQLSRILTLFPDATVLVSAVFNMPELARAVGAAEMALELKILGQSRKFTCGEIRGSMCSRLKKLDEQAGLKDVEEMNRLLRQLVREMQAELMGRQRLIFAASTFDSVKITRDMLAVDCFHPNIRGHELVAGATYHDLITALQQ